MIDEKKLIEVLERNFGGIGGASVLKQLIEAQPKISLENKTSDNMNSSCSGQVWIPCEGCKDCKHKECKNYGKI